MRLLLSLSLFSILPVGDSSFDFGSVVVCCWDGFAVCALTARVSARRFGCPVAYQVWGTGG